MSIGKKIHQIRKMSGMTQEELAEKMNVSRQTVSKWETDASAPDLENAVRLCQLFQISLDDFMNDKSSMERESTLSLQDIVKLNKRSHQMTILMLSGLFFLMIGALTAFFIGALYNMTSSIEYTFYRYIVAGEYVHIPTSYWKMVLPALVLVAVGIVLCAFFIWEKWKEKRNEQKEK